MLVVYDPEGRYRDLCMELANGNISVIDGGVGSISGREKALETFNQIGYQKIGLDGMLVYVPAPASKTEEDKQKDPFAIYTQCGHVFPNSEADRFLYICLTAKPDFTTEIRRIFEENPEPLHESGLGCDGVCSCRMLDDLSIFQPAIQPLCRKVAL